MNGHNNHDWTSGLQSYVEAISLSLQAMMVLLVREREALVGRSDAQSLDAIAQDKQEAVAQVSTLYEMLRENIAQHLGPDASIADGIHVLRDKHPQIAKQVETLIQLTQKCQQANQDNGILVSAGLGETTRAIDTLAEVSANAVPAKTYGPANTPYATPAASQFTARA